MRKQTTIYQVQRNQDINPERINITKKDFKALFEKELSDEAPFIDTYRLIIYTNDDYHADYICQLLADCITLITGEPTKANDIDVKPYITHINDEKVAPDWGIKSLQVANIIRALQLIDKIYDLEDVKYAIHKYQLSIEISTLLDRDLEPNNVIYTKSPSLRTRLAYSIILCYSILEELKLDVQADNDNPSKENGKWNPKVLKDLLERLKGAGIPIDKPITWFSRGNKRKHLYETEYEKLKDYSNDDIQFRDKEVKIENAINEMSFLRSRVSSHKFKDNIEDLSVYDVKNAQLLSRWLLLKYIDALSL